MGILDKLFKRNKAPSAQSAEDQERFKRMAAEPPVSAAQEQANRDIMEGQVADDQAKRAAAAAADPTND